MNSQENKRVKIMMALVSLILWLTGCDDDPKSTGQDTAGAIVDQGVAGEIGGIDAGETSGETAGDNAGMIAGELAGQQAGETIPTFPNVPEGNPLNPEIGLYPYPSDFFLSRSETSETGLEVNIPEEVTLRVLPPETFQGHDGFSRMPIILSAWPGGVLSESLPSATNPEESISTSSTTLIVEQGTDRLIPHLAEVDLTAVNPDRVALILRPLVALQPNTGYAVLIKRGLKNQEGVEHTANEAFTALLNQETTGYEPVDRQLETTGIIIEQAERLGISKEELILAWRFHTRSQSQSTGQLLKLQDLAVDWPLGEVVITRDAIEGENRQFQGTVEMPLVQLVGISEPSLSGSALFEFSLTIPLSVTETNTPRPVLVYGHGFLGTHHQATRSSFNALCRRGQISAVGLNFGIHEELLPLLVQALTGTTSALDDVRARVMQTMVNSSIMVRYLKDRFSLDYSELDPESIYYMGISNGGTFGALFAATTRMVERAVLVVGGGGLSHFLQRATQWNNLGLIVSRSYEDPYELQLLLALVQEQLDPIDPINFVDHLVEPRFEGRGPLRAQIHMARYDSQVANLVTEWVARTANFPLITPSSVDVWGLERIEAPLSQELSRSIPSAMYVYDEGYDPYVGGNIAPLMDNGAHGTVRELDTYQRHIIDFINQGIIQQYCEGPCDPN